MTASATSPVADGAAAALRLFEPSQRTPLLTAAKTLCELSRRLCATLPATLVREHTVAALGAARASQNLAPSLWPVAALVVAVRAGVKEICSDAHEAHGSAWLSQQINAVARTHPHLLYCDHAWVLPDGSQSSLPSFLLGKLVTPDTRVLNSDAARLVLRGVTAEMRDFVVAAARKVSALQNLHFLALLEELADGQDPLLRKVMHDREVLLTLARTSAQTGAKGQSARELLSRLAGLRVLAGGCLERHEGSETLVGAYVHGLRTAATARTAAHTDLSGHLPLLEVLDGTRPTDSASALVEATMQAVREASRNVLWARDAGRLAGLSPDVPFDFLGVVVGHLQGKEAFDTSAAALLQAAFLAEDTPEPVHARLRALAMQARIDTACAAQQHAVAPARRSRVL